MMKSRSLTLLALLLSLPTFAAGDPATRLQEKMKDCVADWAKRPKSGPVMKSRKCFFEVARDAKVENLRDIRLDAMEGFFEASLYATFKIGEANPGSRAELQIADDGRARGLEFMQERADVAASFYWGAAFLTTAAKIRDRGASIPRNLLRDLPKIQEAMNEAIRLDRTYHGYGPVRVYGIYMMQADPAVGGDDTVAEKYLLEAYQKAPGMGQNHLWYAEVLVELNRKPEAIKVLEQFVALDPDNAQELEPKWKPENVADQAKGRKRLEELRAE
jgi:tetratricopeptide (TPR) repeat protein